MASVDKFYIYGGGRWREVDTGSGRIDGWGRAKFLVARNGKLEATRSRSVLAALRALADKKPSAAKEGPQLSYRYPRHKSQERGHLGCEHQCCHHSNSGICTKPTDKKASIAIQCDKVDLSTTNATTHAQKTNYNKNTHEKPLSTKNIERTTHEKRITSTKNVEKTDNSLRKRKRSSSSSENLFHTKVVTVATVHSPRKPEKRRRISSSRKPRDSSSSDDSGSTIKLAKTSPRLQLRRPRPLKRKHSSSGSVILKSKSKPRKIRKKSINESLPRRSARKNFSIVISSDDSDLDSRSDESKKVSHRSSSTELKVDPKRTRERSSTDEPVKKNRTKENSSDEVLKTRLGPKPKDNSSKPVKPWLGPKRGLESLKDESIKHMLGSKHTEESSDEPIKHRPGPKQTLDSSKTESSNHRLGPKRTEKSSSEEPNKRETQESSKDKNKRAERSSTDEPLKTMQLRPKKKKSASTLNNILGPNRKIDGSSQIIHNSLYNDKNYSQDASKELIIDERDVEILRLFLLKNYPDEDLIRFDTDDEYKKMHFYQINPLVNVERCPRIAKMIQDNDKLSLLDFASKLGLRSVSEASSVKRYRTRKRVEKNYADAEGEKIEGKENDGPNKVIHNVDVRKEKKVDSVRREEDKKVNSERREKDKKVNSRRREEDKVGREKDRRERDDTIDTVELSSDSGKKVEQKVPKKKAKVASKRPPLNEYSNLEDHAIVSWVSVGGRACSVNGNRIWRDLQDQYQKITGHARTWHSLRNRYLRYILPRLGALALPSSLQTRLRAAAATGELKAKRRVNKRNSIFKPAIRGAASRRPGPLERTRQESEKEDDNEDSPPRTERTPTLRYSDVTRRFAEKHRYSSERSTSHEPHKSRHISPDESTNRSPRKSRNSDKSASEICNSKRANNRRSSDSSDSRKKSVSPKRSYKNKKSNGVSESRNRDKSRNSSIPKSMDNKTVKSRTSESRKSTLIDKQNKRKESPSPQRNRSSSNTSDVRPRQDSDSSSESDSHSDMPRRKSYRLKSSSGTPRRKSNNSPNRRSNRINSPNRRSNRINSQNRHRSSSGSPRPKSNNSLNRQATKIDSPDRRPKRINSSNRRSNRINSPESKRKSRINSGPNRRKSNRINSPILGEKIRDSSSDSSSFEIKHKSEANRRKSNRVKSPVKNGKSNEEFNTRKSSNSPIETRRKLNSLGESRRNHADSPSESKHKRDHSPESKNSSQRRSNRYKSDGNLGSAKELSKNDDIEKSKKTKRTRKLFNPN